MLTAFARMLMASDAAAAQTNPEVTEKFVGYEHVKALAERLSQSPFVKPKVDLPEPFNNLSAEQYRDIRFRPEQAVWRGERLDYEIQPFPMGWLYDFPVDIWIVEGDTARLMKADGRLFSLGGSLAGKAPETAPFGFSGFRIHGPLNRSDYYDEFAVFQGASYFRAVGRGQVYGASARGLAIDTARPNGEEFPLFRSYWIERPKAAGPEIVVHALLDSVSTTGAYRFLIRPGQPTTIDVEAILYPRRAITHVGIAPLTSMYLFGPAQRRFNGDLRPSVHDSEGLAMLNGRGERLWRPLTNPMKLQTSAFMDKDPKGFGLSQRDRSFANFEDLDAHFEARPSVWIEPRGDWGEGYVELIEIPATEEIHDNIVVYWKPVAGVPLGKPYPFAYRMSWTDLIPVAWTGARVRKTRLGHTKKADTILFSIDFDGPAVKGMRDLPVAEVSASSGSLANILVQQNPEIGGFRVSFELNVGGTDVSELRLALKANDQLISESWLYRWTRS